MYIKRLEIVGFKSFPERILLPLNYGISAVVGPNGCGKSNIIDAIRWVMGEQSPRLLRGRNMDDVLFNGSQGRPASALAEVSLTLASDALGDSGQMSAAETSVTRRLYRSGDSEYLINRNPCRLKDIVNFFTDHGVGTRAYGIIEQGRVGWLVDARPEERRSLIDEAAGITRYKQQKKEAERKIESAELNLDNVSIIKAESKKQLDQISRAAAKAARYKLLREELRELDLALSAQSLGELRKKRKEIKEGREEDKRLLLSILAAISKNDLESENLKLDAGQHEIFLEEKTAKWHQALAARDSLAKELEFTSSALAKSEERRVKVSGELAHIISERRIKLEEKETLKASSLSLKNNDTEARDKSALAREKWILAKNAHDNKNREYDESIQIFNQSEQRASALRAQLAGDESLLNHQQTRLFVLEADTLKAREAASFSTEKLNGLRFRKNSLKKTFEETVEGSNFAIESLRLAERKQAESTRRLNEAESAFKSLSIKIETLQTVKNNFAWYPEGVKNLMEAKELQSSGLIGPLAEFIESPDAYEEAVEAAFGERLAWILVENRGNAIKALDYAKKHNLGRCGFICKDEIDPENRGLNQALLGKCEFLDNLHIKPDLTCGVLTKDGCYAGQGFVAGGRASEQKNENLSLLARLKEIENLKLEEEKASFELRSLRLAAENALDFLEEAKEASLTAESFRNKSLFELNEVEKKFLWAASEEMQALEKQKNLLEEISKIKNDEAGLIASLSQGRQEKSDAEDKASQSLQQTEALRQDLSAQAANMEFLRIDMEESSRASLELANKLENCQYKHDTLDQWLNEAEDSLAIYELENNNLNEEIRLLKFNVESLEAESALIPQKIKFAENELTEAKAKLENSRKQIDNKEISMRDLRRRREDVTSILNRQETDLLSINFSLDKIAEDLKRDWRVIMIDPDENISNDKTMSFQESEKEMPPPPQGESLASLNDGELSELNIVEEFVYDPRDWQNYDLDHNFENKRNTLKTKIGSLGDVSLEAIEREAELKAEYKRYQEQYDDLTKAIADLKDSIQRINHTCKIRFAETFDAVNCKFQEIFPILFEGGEAWLSLSDEDDPLESGVEIHVHPPGKKMLLMSLLSGGEKALTALALIFALYLIKPSPFCLLDETDAPLDDANIDRFNRLLRQLSKTSQIIMVTHNKRSMQISHTLYGVTMENPGVSRLVSVNLAEAEALTNDV